MHVTQDGNDVSLEELAADKILEEATIRINDLHGRLSIFENDKGPKLTPSGMGGGGLFDRKERSIFLLKEAINDEKVAARAKTLSITKNSSLETQAKVHSKTYNWINQPVKGVEDLKDRPSEKADTVSKSQDDAMNKINAMKQGYTPER